MLSGWPATKAVSEFHGARAALLITTAAYADSTLSQLRAPTRDAAGMAAVLADSQIGGFEVTEISDERDYVMKRAVAAFLDHRTTDDLIVVYLSCHGIQDAHGRLYFAATNTRRDELRATAIESSWLLDALEECRARRQVLILDCCFSGAFAHTKSGDAAVDLEHQFATAGRGRVVLTASRAEEYSYEGRLPDADDAFESAFTAGLIAGLRSGDADENRDGLITVEEAYQYAADHVHSHGASQTPQRWVYGGEAPIMLARTARGVYTGATPPPETSQLALESSRATIRQAAIALLEDWLRTADPAHQLAISAILESIVGGGSPTPTPEQVAGPQSAAKSSAASADDPPISEEKPMPTSGDAHPPGRRLPFWRRHLWALLGGLAVLVVAAATLGVIMTDANSDRQPSTLPFSGLAHPWGVAVDSSNNVYVTDNESNRILKLPAGKHNQQQLPVPDLDGLPLSRPAGIAVDDSGTLYVADQGNNRVLKLPSGSGDDTTAARVLPFSGLTAPAGVAVDESGAVYVADYSHDRVLKLPKNSDTQEVLPFTDLHKPMDVAVDQQGGVVVTDTIDHEVLRAPADFRYQEPLPFPDLDGPTGVSVDQLGNVYLAEHGKNKRVRKWSPDSEQLTTLPIDGLANPNTVAVSAATIYVVDFDRNDVFTVPIEQSSP